MDVIIDRFEGEFAIVELPDRTMANLPIILVPDAKEGDVIKIIIDDGETNKRAERINKLAKKLWAD